MSLERLAQLVSLIGKTTSSKQKVDILRAHHDLKQLLLDIYSTKSFGITSAAIQPASGESKIKNLSELVRLLNQGELKNSKESSIELSRFVSKNSEYKDIIKNIVDKNLKIRIGPSLLKRAFGSMDGGNIPIALGFQLETLQDTIDHVHGSMLKGERWLASRKIDGVRCLVRIDLDRQVTIMSRHGRPFRSAFLNSTFKHFFDAHLRLPFETGGQVIYIDGELAVIDHSDRDQFKESFTDTIKVVMSEHADAGLCSRLHYFMFDCLTESELYGTSNVLSRRLDRLIHGQERIHKLPQFHLDDPADSAINQLCTTAQSNNWEGVMLRRNAPYSGTRSKDLLKIKLFKEEEFRVVDIETGRMRLFKDGSEQDLIVCTALVISIDDKYRCAVGSGLSTEDRIEFALNPQLVLNKFITVKYFEKTRNEKGEISLRFPVFKCVREC